MQHALDELLSWCLVNGMHLNNTKTKEMVITFGSRVKMDKCTSLISDGCVIVRVHEFKILGVILSSDLTWTKHVKYIVSKASKRIFAICHLVRCGLWVFN